jgi:hypothetical protein
VPLQHLLNVSEIQMVVFKRIRPVVTAPYTYCGRTGYDKFHFRNSNGVYSVTTTDQHGCTTTTQATVNTPSQLNVSIQKSDATCYASNTGVAAVSVSGGTPGTVFMVNGATASTCSNLAAGNYVVAVNDTNGCRVDSFLHIQQPPPM